MYGAANADHAGNMPIAVDLVHEAACSSFWKSDTCSRTSPFSSELDYGIVQFKRPCGNGVWRSITSILNHLHTAFPVPFQSSIFSLD